MGEVWVMRFGKCAQRSGARVYLTCQRVCLPTGTRCQTLSRAARPHDPLPVEPVENLWNLCGSNGLTVRSRNSFLSSRSAVTHHNVSGNQPRFHSRSPPPLTQSPWQSLPTALTIWPGRVEAAGSEVTSLL
ncbi:unnamed protein product [Pleuronectes platessa]|uniref:Uncharacterized protein n=1 Tax=Pleuronectes platessa TaxID=8262 RepID=A0A9N7U002_PLEPL|nr:unnamed protein product [Pleuronectes platessa]